MATPGRYTFPLPPGYTQGRTDEGVDFLTQAGTPIRAIGRAIVDFVGRYTGFGPTYVAYHLTEGPQAGQEIYVGHSQAVVRRGQQLVPGQTVALARGYDTHTAGQQQVDVELGFAQRGGGYLPEANQTYMEGDVTASGLRFRSFLAGATPGATGGPSGRLAALWINAGGPRGLADTMAAIAMAESHGDPNAKHQNSDGSLDRGLWQINSRNFDSDRLYDPQVNAQWAVRIYRSQGLGAWTTYNSGAYRQYLSGAATATVAGAGPAGTVRARPAGGGGDSSWSELLHGAEGGLTAALNPVGGLMGLFGHVGDVAGVLKAFLWLIDPRQWLRMVEFVVGVGLMVLGAIGLGVVFAARNPTVRQAAMAAQAAPGPVGAAGKAVTVAGAGGGRRERTRAAEQLAPTGVRRRRAERQGAREERRRQEVREQQAARERGRRRVRVRSADERVSRQTDEIPF